MHFEFSILPLLQSLTARQQPSNQSTMNHDYIRAINGEVRLWVNGEEVSGGTAIEPKKGFVCLESEGSPIQFRKLRMRDLP